MTCILSCSVFEALSGKRAKADAQCIEISRKNISDLLMSDRKQQN